jgi:tetratricopeptide (TPR) repeat protein
MKRKTVSLCMIARDEEACIGKAIKSALALVDEIVVVDTGSRDNTRIIAEGYGARIVDDVWRDDFASARNAALAAAACDWILVLDCDEQLQSVRPVDFQRLINDPGVAGYRLQVTEYEDVEHIRIQPTLRLFRNHPDVRYRYPVREDVTASLLRTAGVDGQVVLDAPFLVLHDPGDADTRSRKRDRNLRLLRQAINDQPREPFFAHQLARETLQFLDGEVLPVAGLQGSLDYLLAAWRRVSEFAPDHRRQLPYGRQLASDLVASLLAVGDWSFARDVVDDALLWWGGDAFLHLNAARTCLAQLADDSPCDERTRARLIADFEHSLQQVTQAAAAATAAEARLLVLNRYRLFGDLALLENRISEASEAYEHALDQDQAYAAAWVGLADCARLAGDRKRALRLYLRAVTASEWNPLAWVRGCELLDELGFHDNASSWRTKLQEQFPEHAAVREGLVEPLTV